MKIVLQLSVLKATGFLSQLGVQGRRWGRKMKIAQGVHCLQAEAAEAPPTWRCQSHFTQC